MKTAVKTRRRRWLLPAAGGLLLALTWGLWTVCGQVPAVSAVFRRIAQLLSTGLGFLSGLLPIPAAEVLIAALVIIALARLVRLVRTRDVQLLLDSLCQLVLGV